MLTVHEEINLYDFSKNFKLNLYKGVQLYDDLLRNLLHSLLEHWPIPSGRTNVTQSGLKPRRGSQEPVMFKVSLSEKQKN